MLAITFAAVRCQAIVCLLLAAISGTQVIAQDGQQVRIVEVIWGFDGRVVPGQFMPLSILVDNLSDQPLEARASLRSVAGMIREIGGTATQPVFLGPNSRRWVQFYPYIAGMTSSWRFTLETDEKKYAFDDIDQARAVFDNNSNSDQKAAQSLPAVILDQTGVLSKMPTSIKHMPAEIFPPYATATLGLHALFLDHVPDWESPRQDALLSWLKSGGRLHLLLDQNNQTLRFSGSLAAMNEPFPEFRVGAGTVTRHDFQRAELSLQVVAPVVTPPDLAPEDDEDAKAFNQRQSSSGFNFRTGLIDDDEMFSELRQLTQPDHAWWLILLLSLCYVGLIFPGCWILSRQRTLHFLVTYGAIAGLAAVFSLFFLLIGRRGYGESTSVHTLAIARGEDETHWSVFEYNMLFVTSGDIYAIKDTDHQTLLSSGANESVDAEMTSGNTASFVSRIPPFSSQAVLSRRRLKSDDWKLVITEFSQSGSQLSGLTVSFGDTFPAGEEVQCYVMHGRDLHHTTLDRARKALTLTNSRERLQHFCYSNRDDFGNPVIATPLGIIVREEEIEPDPIARCFQRVLPRLVQRSLVDECVQDVFKFRLPEGRVRLLVYARLPEAMQMPVNADARRDGRILFVRELALSSDSGISGEAVDLDVRFP